MSGGVSRNMNGAGAKTSRGCGSKVSITAGTPRALACAFSRSSTAWWPRCTPSNEPMATIAPLSAAGTLSRPSRRWKLVTRRSAWSVPAIWQERRYHARRGMKPSSRAPLGATSAATASGSGAPKASRSCGVDRAGDEQQIEPGIGRADGVGADAVADGEDAAAVERRGRRRLRPSSAPAS